MPMSRMEGDVGGQICSQCLPRHATTGTVLGFQWLVRLRVVGSMVISLLQPVGVGIIIPHFTEIVEHTAGCDHAWHKSEMKVISF